MLSERIKSAMQFAIFAELTALEFEHVIGAAREKRFARTETIFTEGDPVRQVTLVVSGLVKVTQMSLNANEVILRLSGAGEIVGSYRVSNSVTHCTTAQAVQPCVALVWDSSTFEKLQAWIPVFRRNTVRALEERLLEMEQRFREVSTERVGSRLSSELVLIARYRELLAEEVASLQNLSTKTMETHIMRKESVLAGFLEKGQWLNVSSELEPLQLKLSVVIVATDNEQRALLQVLVDGTIVARSVHACANFPVAGDDPVTRRVRAANPDVILVDIPVDKSRFALRAIELLHQEVPESAIFAIGSLSQERLIANAVRAGAREFIERPATTADLLEAFARLTTRTARPELLS